MRWVVGITFIVASFHKIAEPASFAKIIYGYDLFPHIAINFFAIVLPFVEMLTGLFLVLNFWPKASASLAGIMLAVFIIAISINMARGHVFDCGCFSFGSKSLMTGNWSLLIRDALLLSLCFGVLRSKDGASGKWTFYG
jgi:uncharacterized membrane protein YphA (DoxX/SURF4 family)